MPNHFGLRIFFVDRIMRLLPRDWVYSFQAYDALEYYSLDDFMKMTVTIRSEEVTRWIMELCIRTSEPLDQEWRSGNYPIVILRTLQQLNAMYVKIPRFWSNIPKFDGKLYTLTRSPECYDSERILKLFCTEPAEKIQFAWKNYLDRKRDQASRIIQEKVLEWLYRPGGPMMKKAEASFYFISIMQ